MLILLCIWIQGAGMDLDIFVNYLESSHLRYFGAEKGGTFCRANKGLFSGTFASITLLDYPL
jgi:hypothetical protein